MTVNSIKPARSFFSVSYLFFLLAILLTGSGCATSKNFSTSKYDRYIKATVEILVDGRLQGSGWFVSKSGEIITAAHVIKSGNKMEAIDATGYRFTITPIAADIGNDIALLKPTSNLFAQYYLIPADKIPPPGTMIHFVGSALFRHNVALPGWVARGGLTYEYSPIFEDYTRVYHIAASTPSGSSGGCWIDKDGRVVGVQSGMMTLGNAAQGIAYASPPDAIKNIIVQKKSACTTSIQCAIEEIWEQSPDLIKSYPQNARGVVVAKITKNGVAEKAGLKKNDLILSINGAPTQRRDEFMSVIRNLNKGDIIALEILSPNSIDKKVVNIQVQSLEEIYKMDY